MWQPCKLIATIKRLALVASIAERWEREHGFLCALRGRSVAEMLLRRHAILTNLH